MGNIPRLWLTNAIPWISSLSHEQDCLERLGASQSQKLIVRGLPCKIGFGRRIGYKNVVGTIVDCVHFASKPKNPPTISSFIAVSP
jgi:hypothetical protein